MSYTWPCNGRFFSEPLKSWALGASCFLTPSVCRLHSPICHWRLNQLLWTTVRIWPSVSYWLSRAAPWSAGQRELLESGYDSIPLNPVSNPLILSNLFIESHQAQFSQSAAKLLYRFYISWEPFIIFTELYDLMETLMLLTPDVWLVTNGFQHEKKQAWKVSSGNHKLNWISTFNIYGDFNGCLRETNLKNTVCFF